LQERINVHCFEFKSGSFPEGLVDQLTASEAWCRALHSTIKHYTGAAKRLHLTKFVLSCHSNPAAYLDASGKYLLRDHCIRHYLYQDIDGLALTALDNTNVEAIN
jgi:protoheme ferro-lyase